MTYEYITSKVGAGTVHITTNRPDDSATLCGRPIGVDWTRGDETITGLAATCASCQRSVR